MQLINELREHSGPSASFVSGVFKIEKALFPKDKNWGKIKQINKAKKARLERDARSVGLELEELRELLQPIDKAFPELRMNRRRPADVEGEGAADGKDGADNVPALHLKDHKDQHQTQQKIPQTGYQEEEKQSQKWPNTHSKS